MRLSIVKRTVMATALAVATAVAGVAGQAQAFTFGSGDLVLAIYGNNNEALVNLGSASTILAPGGAGILNLDLSAALAGANIGSATIANGLLQYTLFEHDFNQNTVIAATGANPAAIVGQLGLGTQSGLSINMSFTPSFDSTNLVPKADAQSFTNNLNQSGSGTMGGSWPVAMQGSIGQVLNVLQGDIGTQTFTQVGRVLLTANGLLTVGNPGPAAVPLPAAVVLFGSGLIGLVGIARRAIRRQAAA
jgi:hypothetical protein